MAELELKTGQLLDVLDACITDIRAGRKTIQDCLDANPVHRAELAMLLPVAAAIVPVDVEPDPIHKLHARHRLVEAIHQDTVRESGLFVPLSGLRNRIAAVAAAVVLALGGSGAAVVAAQDAQPADPLYGLKTAIEQQQVAFAASPDARAQLRLRIADRRLAEAERAIEAGREDVAVIAASSYSEAMQQAYSDIDAATGAGAPTSEAHGTATESLARLQSVAVKADAAGESAAAAALAAAGELAARERAPRSVQRAPVEAPTPAITQVRVVNPTAELPQEDASEALSEDELVVPPPPTGQEARAVPPVTAPAARAVPTQTMQRGNSGSAQVGNGNDGQRGASLRGGEQNDDRDSSAGRGTDGGNGQTDRPPTPQPQRALGPTATAIPTATPRRIDTPTVDRGNDDRDGGGNRGGGNGQGRESDDDRGRDSTPTAAPRLGSDDRSRPTATATPRVGSPPASSRSSSRENGDGDRDREDNRGDRN
jgi:hypothetical protein